MRARCFHLPVLGAACGVALLAGCSFAPKYSRPTVLTAEGYRDSVALALPDSTIANAPWWELFEDEQLAELICVALAENKDLAIAVERIEEARARYGFTRADLYPMLQAGIAGGGLRTSAGSLMHLPDEEVDETQEIYAVSLDLSWEIDIFGRIRNASAAEKAAMLGTIETRRAVVLTLIADAARAYFELRDADRQLEIARSTLDSRREYIDLARVRLEGGVAPETDLRQAEAEYHRIAVQAFELEKRIVQKENEIAVLLGRLPASVARGRPVAAQSTPPAVPAGIPAALLERRPDIRAAEQDLIAANAQIGVAKAMLFPRLALTGSFGYANNEIGDLFVGANQSWNLIGSLVQPIFNANKNRRRVDISESQQRQLLYSYERTILRAMQEVEDALVAYHKSGQQRAAQRARVEAEQKVLELSETRYVGGVAPYLEVLDAQRSLFAAEIDEASTIRTHVVSLVQLYKALGGGWTQAEADSAAAAAAH